MKKTLLSATTMIILCMSSGFATADDYGGDGAKSWSKKGMEKMMMGRHSMSGTITDINQQTGWINLKTAAGDMKLHFPEASVKDLKSGDTISVHLSFSKGDEMMMKGEKKMDGKMMDEKKMMK